MAKKQKTPSHVSGFIKKLTPKNKQQMMTFVVAKQPFVLPAGSTFGTAVQAAENDGQNVLVLFENTESKHPRVLGVIAKPFWAQVDAASKGETFETVKALLPKGKAPKKWV